MGTETNIQGLPQLNHLDNLVKLNNPLMGTETIRAESNIRKKSVPG